jgi:cell shape-determining protein MreC
VHKRTEVLKGGNPRENFCKISARQDASRKSNHIINMGANDGIGGNNINKNSEYTLIGNISRAGQLTLNGQKVTLKEDGEFEIILSLREGENRLELQVSKDNKPLKTTQKIVYKQ